MSDDAFEGVGDALEGPDEAFGGLEGQELILTELVSRVLDRGVMVAGEVTISVAGIDLVELGLRLRLVSTETRVRAASEAATAGPRLPPGVAPAPSDAGQG